MPGSDPTRRQLKYGGCILLAWVAAVLLAVPVFGQTRTVTLVGAGDLASCSHDNDSATAKLLGNLGAAVRSLPRGAG